jgi:hypothetical protein
VVLKFSVHIVSLLLPLFHFHGDKNRPLLCYYVRSAVCLLSVWKREVVSFMDVRSAKANFRDG